MRKQYEVFNEMVCMKYYGHYPTLESSDAELRQFVVRVLGGKDSNIDADNDNHFRLDFYRCNGQPEANESATRHNNLLLQLFERLGFLSRIKNVNFYTWKGSAIMYAEPKSSWDGEVFNYFQMWHEGPGYRFDGGTISVFVEMIKKFYLELKPVKWIGLNKIILV